MMKTTLLQKGPDEHSTNITQVEKLPGLCIN